MPKKEKKSDKPAGDAKPGVFESFGRKIDEIPKVRRAEEAVAAARDELAKAKQSYEHARDEARRRVTELRDQNLGDVVDEVAATVRKHPVPCVLGSLFLGLLLGRFFWRR